MIYTELPQYQISHNQDDHNHNPGKYIIIVMNTLLFIGLILLLHLCISMKIHTIDNQQNFVIELVIFIIILHIIICIYYLRHFYEVYS